MPRSLLSLSLLIGFTITLSAQNLSNSAKEKIHQFDFWIGEWTVYNYRTDTIAGYSHIESIMDSMAIQEHYHVPSERGSYKGTSLNKYNFSKQQWEQYYIDNARATLPLEGGMIDGKMILGNIQNTSQGKVINRITWTPIDDGTVRQTWHARSNEKEEWKVLFDGHYRKSNK